MGNCVDEASTPVGFTFQLYVFPGKKLSERECPFCSDRRPRWDGAHRGRGERAHADPPVFGIRYQVPVDIHSFCGCGLGRRMKGVGIITFNFEFLTFVYLGVVLKGLRDLRKVF